MNTAKLFFLLPMLLVAVLGVSIIAVAGEVQTNHDRAIGIVPGGEGVAPSSVYAVCTADSARLVFYWYGDASVRASDSYKLLPNIPRQFNFSTGPDSCDVDISGTGEVVVTW